MPSQWVKQRASPRSLHQDALKQIHDAQPVRPETQAIAIQAVALNASDGLNVAPLSLGRLATPTIPLEFPQQRVLRRIDVQGTAWCFYALTMREPFRLERIVARNEEVHLMALAKWTALNDAAAIAAARISSTST